MALEIDSTETFDSKELMDTVWSAVAKFYGECGASRTGLSMIDYDMSEKSVVIRVSNVALEMVRAALASVTKIGDVPAAIHVLKVSGTIKALHRKA